MNENQVWTPGITFAEVSQRAESVRSDFESLQQIPVDIEGFLEFDLGIDIVPYTGLRDAVNAEAIISQDFTTIYVDAQSYLNDKYWNRLKFSIAHEIGHLYLHKDFFDKQNVKDEEDWIQLMLDLRYKYYFLEHHANWFAGVLLVPEAELAKELLKQPSPSILELTRHFEVSQKVIEKRLASPDMETAIGMLKGIRSN